MKAYLPLVLLAMAGGLGFALGLGGASVLAALTAMFCFMAAFGGTLAADLRLLAWFGPLLVVVVGVVRLLSSAQAWPVIGLVTLIVFAAGLVPVLGPRYQTVGLGLGMATVFGYGFPATGAATAAWQAFAAPAVGVAVVVGWRAALGAADPGGPLRTALAESLTGQGLTSMEQTVRTWLADRPRRWTEGVLNGTRRYRVAVDVLADRGRRMDEAAGADVDRLLAAGRAEAERLAEAVRARSAPPQLGRVRRVAPGRPLPGDSAALVTTMWQGLEQVEAANLDRDQARVDYPSSLARDALFDGLRGGLSWNSSQLRHAVRCALGMLAALLVAHVGFPGNPLVMVFLLSTFMIMQPAWRASVAKAWQRVAGTLLGAAALALVVWLAQPPEAALVGIGVAALLVGFYFQQSRPIVFNACTVLMGVAMNASMRHLDLRQTMLEYLLLIAIAVVIGLLFGFGVVPGVRELKPAERFAEGVESARALLVATSAGLARGVAEWPALRSVFRAAASAEQNLAGGPEVGAERDPGPRRAEEDAAEGLRGLRVACTALLLRAPTGGPLAEPVRRTAEWLDPSADPERPLLELAEVATRLDPEQRLLLNGIVADVLVVRRAAPALADV